MPTWAFGPSRNGIYHFGIIRIKNYFLMVYYNMPFKRKYKKGYKNKKRYPKKQIQKPLGNVYRFVRSAYVTTLSSLAAATSYFAFSFKLSDLPNYTEFTQLFDEYKISKLQYKFLPGALTQNTLTTIATPTFMYAIDKDDATVPTSLDTLLQYPGVKIRNMDRGFTVSFVPRVAATFYNTAVTSAYGSTVHYLDAANDGVPHYGIHGGFGRSLIAGAYTYDVYVKVWVHCRGVR